MANNSTPAQTGFSRVQLIEGRARPDHAPSFQSCLRSGPIEQSFGDITKIECPDPERWDGFVEVGKIKGEIERATTNLMGRYAADVASTILRLAKEGCPIDVHVNLGSCSDPRDNNVFTKKIIFEDANITNYSTPELGALASGDRAVIDETGDISAREVYEVLRLGFAERAGDIVTNEVIDVVICDSPSCGDCEDQSNGCEKIFSLTLSAGGSPSTPADVVFSINGGVTWYAHDIDSLGAAENPSALACIGSYLVVVSNASNSLHYALLSEFDGVTDPAWTEVSTGFVTGGEPNDIWSVGNSAFIVGDGGYIYLCTDPTAGVTVLDAGVAVQDDLLAVHAINEDVAVAVGNASAVVKTANGSTWQSSTPRPAGVGVNLNTVWVKELNEWFTGGSNGNLYYTLNGGTTWTIKTFSGSGAGVIRDIAFSTDSVAYMSHDTATPRGRLLRSYDGGHSWVVLPETSGNLPLSDRITAIATCEDDPNLVVGVGLGDNGSDGFIVIGQD